MIISIGSARPLPGRREELVAAAVEMTAATRLDEGCESYGFYADLTDPEVVVSLEVWRDQAALDDHMTHDHTRRFLDRVPGLLDGAPQMAFHEVPDPR